MSTLLPEKVPVLFADVAAYFSEEEWKPLHEWKNELYRNVMKELQQALTSLGPIIAASVFSLRAKEKEDMFPVDNQVSEREQSMNSSSRFWTVKPENITRIDNWEEQSVQDLLSSAGSERLKRSATQSVTVKPEVMPRVDEMEEPWAPNHQKYDGRERDERSATQSVTVKPEVIAKIEELQFYHIMDHPKAESRESTEKSATGCVTVKPANISKIEEWERTSAMHQQDSEGRERTFSPGCVAVDSHRKHYNALSAIADNCNNTSAAVPYRIHSASSMSKDTFPGTIALHTRTQAENQCFAFVNNHILPAVKKAEEAYFVYRPDSDEKESIRCPSSGDQNVSVSVGSADVIAYTVLKTDTTLRKEEELDACMMDHHGAEIGESSTGLSSAHAFITPDEEGETDSMDDQGPDRTESITMSEDQSDIGSMNEKKPYICSECNKIFTYKSTLQQHQRIHTVERLFPCTEYEKRFPSMVKLVRHHRIHTGVKPYPCTQCDKSFTQKIHLQHHLKIHTGEKPFTCSECNKSFTLKTDLKRHLRIHTEEKSFICTECKKSFTRKTGLQHHMRIHTGVKPFTCSECKKSFTVKTNLLKHMRIHTGEKPFSCTQCEKRFNQKTVLQRHLRIHTGEKPFPCTECEKRFTQKIDLQRHLRIHTGVRGSKPECKALCLH